MQAVIMAGGKGTRLSSLTGGKIPKPMVDVDGMPLLERQILTLKREGVNNILIVLGHLGNVIKDYFGDGAKLGVRIDYYQETQPLGTAGSLPLFVEKLEDRFFYLFGDVLFDLNLQKLLNFHQSKNAFITMMVHPNTHPFDSDLVITDDNDRVIDLDPKNPDRNYYYNNKVNAGMYVMEKGICDYIKAGQIKQDLEKDIVLPLTKTNKPIFAYSSSEYLKDIGTPERIKAAVEELKTGKLRQKNLNNPQKAIFLDRDGTINKSNGYVYRPDLFELEEHVIEAIKKINASGYLAIVVTNQPSVARGLASIDDINLVNKKMETLLGQGGVYLDAIYFCPHHPESGFEEENKAYKIPCSCRKPDVGMIQKAKDKFNIDLASSWIIGDTTTDIQTGINAGMHAALVMTGEKGEDKQFDCVPDIIAPNLDKAVELILCKDDNHGL